MILNPHCWGFFFGGKRGTLVKKLVEILKLNNMKNFVKCFLIICIATGIHSCKSTKNLVNNQFPPLSTTDQQYTSVERNLLEMEAINPHLGLHIDKDIILEYLPAEIKKAAEKVNDEKIVIHKLVPKVSFDKQGIFIDTDFFITIPELKIEIKGNFIGATAVSTQSDSLYLRSALSSLKLESIKYTKKLKLPKKALAKLLVPIFKNYIENLNGQIFKAPTVVYTGWGETYKLSLKKMFRDPNTEVIADSLEATRFTKKNAIRIKSNGVSVLVELAKTKPSTEPSISNLAKSKTNSELNKIFKTYDERFDMLWLSTFEPIDVKTSFTANISKAEIAAIFNEALSKPITLKQNFTIPNITFNQKLEVKSSDVDCQKTRKPFTYERYNRKSCNWSCRVSGPFGTSFNDPVCMASRALCNTKEEAKVAADNIRREAELAAHNIANESRVAACNVLREATGFMALGRFKGDLAGNGKALINLNSFLFKEDLSEISLNYSGQVEAKLNSNLELNPVDLGYIFFCYGNYDKKTESNINLNIPTATSKITINSIPEGENLNLNIKLDKVSYEASINPSPLHSLLTDPRFYVQCPISTLILAGGIGAASAKLLGMIKLAPEQELLLMGKAKGQYGVDQMQIPFKPIIFRINQGQDRKAQIFWNTKSIQFTHFKLIPVTNDKPKKEDLAKAVISTQGIKQ